MYRNKQGNDMYLVRIGENGETSVKVKVKLC